MTTLSSNKEYNFFIKGKTVLAVIDKKIPNSKAFKEIVKSIAGECCELDVKRIRVSFDEQTKRSDLLKNMDNSWKGNVFKSGTKESKFQGNNFKSFILNVQKQAKEISTKDSLKVKYLEINEKLTKEIFKELQETQSKVATRVDFGKIKDYDNSNTQPQNEIRQLSKLNLQYKTQTLPSQERLI